MNIRSLKMVAVLLLKISVHFFHRNLASLTLSLVRILPHYKILTLWENYLPNFPVVIKALNCISVSVCVFWQLYKYAIRANFDALIGALAAF